ncbi:MAG: hypothetical protein U0838_15980 [Chloroflexota bacterium]
MSGLIGGSGRGVPVLLGALSLDIYLGRDLVLPVAARSTWSALGEGGRVAPPAVARGRRPASRVPRLPRTPWDRAFARARRRGASASIDIVIQPDLQPHMDHFVEGVWADFACTAAEEQVVADAEGLHLVLVEGAIRELTRLADAGVLEPGGVRGPEVTADFLGFRHYTVERLADTMHSVDIGYVGWPGSPDDDGVAGIRDVAHRLGRLVIVTLGSQGVLAFDRRPGGEDRCAVTAVPSRAPRAGRRVRRRIPRRVAARARRPCRG